MIEVLQSGTRATLQDSGRRGHRSRGIPASGAADRLSFAVANWMVGNVWNTPAIECVLGGQHFRFHQDTLIGLAGAEMWAQVNGQNVTNYTAFPVEKGDILTLSFSRQGCRAYITVPGGFNGHTFLGSVSTYLPAGLGGIEGRALKVGDHFQIHPVKRNPRKLPPGYRATFSNHIVLRTRPGPEFEDLTQESQRHLFINPFIATRNTNRMGARLRGNRISMRTYEDMTSGPLLPGTLQVPADSQPVLAMTDAHCTGGYPRVLQVITADYWLLGQVRPGSKVSFQRCFSRDAIDILKRRTAFYRSLMDGFSF
ncbi:MAG: biotin-dependent carboxyltransferase family protein [Hyphomonadaceae bacterium]|nr:biotin-dependent carboxyltransferase family protein [Hyphomonadaceae bacterium]MBC6412281.1 biotin-dependent carboxyltransferase family protein [Hyphomonadaceae bacterium]